MHRHVGSELLHDPLTLRPDLRVRVVATRDEQRGDLEPDVGLALEIHEGVEHRLQVRAGELYVELFGEPLQIDVGRIHLRVELAPRLRVHVARGHRHGLDSPFATGVGDVHRVLREDDRVVVGERDAAAAVIDCRLRDRFRRRLVGQPIHVLGLRDVPVLAELAREVAARGAEREDGAAGVEMVERLLLDRVDAETGRSAIRGEHHAPAFHGAHEARAALAFVQPAVARTEVALDAAVRERVPPAGGIERVHADIGAIAAVSASMYLATE